MKTRIISGIIGLILLFAIVFVPILLNISIFLISIVGLYEFNKTVRNIEGLKPLEVLNYVFTLGLFAIITLDRLDLFSLVLISYILILLTSFVLNEKLKLENIAVTALGAFYIPFCMSHLALLGNSIYLWLVFITSWGTDTFAYFVGIKFGKKKLCPKLSPKKSVEGSIGGIIGSLFLTLIFINYFKLDNILSLSIFSIVCSVMAQIGDLTASKIKRSANVKDFGNIMPGHGGVLDRFDSILFTGPLVYYYITLFL